LLPFGHAVAIVIRKTHSFIHIKPQPATIHRWSVLAVSRLGIIKQVVLNGSPVATEQHIALAPSTNEDSTNVTKKQSTAKGTCN
jgi:hypothetical protein